MYVESCGREDHRVAKRQRKDEHKQELAIVAVQQIQEAQRRGLVFLYIDGSAKLVGGVGWVAGYGCHEPGLWEEANHLPVGRKQTINRAELMAVIVAVRRTHTHGNTRLQLQPTPRTCTEESREQLSNGEPSNG